MTPLLVVTRGIAASGKTTFARAWVAENPTGRARVNRDDLRASLFGEHGVLSYEQEKAISAAQQAAVRALLESGRSVVVDDTNIRLRYVRQWAELAGDAGAEFELRDFDTDVETCIERDSWRVGKERVGADVIRGMHSRLASARREKAPEAASGYRYVPDHTLPPAWVVDIDGTLALMDGRSPYDYTRVSEDLPNEPVLRLATSLADNWELVVMSGRDASCYDETLEWLMVHLLVPFTLVMRPEGDKRDDAVVKLELFREHVAPHWCVLGVLDDRNRVVRMWRRIGLLCLQVAPGAF